MPVSSPRDGDGTVVVPIPGEIDAVNSAEIGGKLISAIDAGAPAVVADMTSTEFCDSAGVQAMVRAYRHGREHGCALRLVIGSAAVRRVFSLTEVDRLIPVCASMEEACEAAPGPIP